MSEYPLSSDAEAGRLRVQAEVWQAEVETLFDQIDVQRGWRCLDLACGSVGVLAELGHKVGPDGAVVGVDRDPALIAGARFFAEERGLSNVRIAEGDARETGLPSASFDLTHARFLLVFGQADPILREMIRLTRPGGLIVVQETEQSSWLFLDRDGRPHAAWMRLKEALESAFESFGGDANIGRRLPSLLRDQGLVDVRMRAAVKAVPACHPYLRMPIIGARTLKSRICDEGILAPGELEAILTEMERIVRDPETIALWFTVIQAWGRKP